MSPSSEHRTPRKLVVVDAANTVYRAFFALPPLRADDGTPTQAVYGFTNMLLKAIREEGPDYLVVAFDAPGRTFRDEMHEDYKATRDAQPEDLSTQLPLVREVIEAQRIPILEVPGFEADDIIATLVAGAPPDLHVTIVSTDKDLMQLVGGRVELLDTMKDRRIGPAQVEERFGVSPEQVLDLRALTGDPSDNIPGVRGIGEKGAAKLIREWGSLEAVLDHVNDIRAKRPREALQSQAEQARLSKELARLRYDVPLPLKLEDLARREPDEARLRELYRRLGFVRLLEALGDGGAGDGAAARGAEPSPVKTRTLTDPAGLEPLAGALRARERLTLLPVDGNDGGGPAGIAFALGPEEAAYVPLRGEEGGGDASEALPLEAVAGALRPLLEGPETRPWAGREVKRATGILAACGIRPLPAAFDVDIAAYLIDFNSARSTQALAAQLLGRELRSFEDIAGRGAAATPAAGLSRETLAAWAGDEVCAIDALVAPLRERLERDGLLPLFEDVEMPLTAVLARMEQHGVRVDEKVLALLSEEYESELSRIEGQIYASAGEKFLISSPKQLQAILFEKLKLPVVRKTKTGYSTDEGVLEQLAAHHDLPRLILAHRRLAKLKGTYIDALPRLIDPRTGRIHPTFNQAGAATGRLSCANPNMQNIPIRSPEGVRIREAFVAAEGMRLLAADYSQFELRILAHYAGDEKLLEAFRTGEDIHRRTAGDVFGVPGDAVTADQRARAKAVNFGIIYGSSAFGIANQLGIATGEAQATIDAYFARYEGVRRFIQETIASAREHGHVRTILGRRRYLPDLMSRNRVMRSAAERMAVNTVIQGSEADLIKKAMVEVDAFLAEQGLRARMILQVHDELVFEVPEEELEYVGPLLKERLQNVYALRVPLVVDLGTGRSWREAH